MKALGFGAILWDECPEESGDPGAPRPSARGLRIGGSVFNVIVHLRRLGGEAYMVSALGNDELGGLAFREMRRMGIDGEFVETVQEPTCRIHVTFDADGSPRYSSPPLVSWDRISVRPETAERIRSLGFDFLVFGTLEQRDAVSRAALEGILAGGGFGSTYIDLTLRGGAYNREMLDRSMRRTNIVKMNEEEARVVNELFELHQDDPSRLLQLIRREFANDIVCITLGGRGALVGDDSQTLHMPGYRVRIADTVGSGDAFSAGLLFQLAKGAPLGDACDFGNRMGALISSKRGALPEYDLGELDSLRVE